MLKRIWILLILALSQIAYTTEGNEEVGLYKPAGLPSESREGWEQLKREFIQIEELKTGTGPIAAWGARSPLRSTSDTKTDAPSIADPFLLISDWSAVS